ncbi:hypothetical protein ACFSKI_09745 [Pseudogracilibacillus auburnensis]|uniref:Uncharacterized protein n=1 Tax=Pseudogracilibacillus auburnensis TaxID=1494959 RepID=A0A2V3VQS4_9BACI|nr:hypothetical protein [Pseudogracilibacillus auburnensis]PXW82355.1 hypothetical protein DFR56_11942 [Pseudogracilibacillus auburnensis]
MEKTSILKVAFTIGLLILIKVFQDSIPRNSDLLTNIIVPIAFVIFVSIYGASELRKNKKEQ